jgi:tetratricopeptide (TPR) repeat protein
MKLLLGCTPVFLAGALGAQTGAVKEDAVLLTAEGTVQVFATDAKDWASAQTNQALRIGDRLRTGPRSRATARLSDLTVLRINELTTLQIREPRQAGKQSLEVNAGSAYFFSRQRPAQQEFRTPLTSGAIRGTEFNLEVGQDGRTVVALIDGGVTLSNELGRVDMNSGEKATVDPGKAPVKTPMLEAINIIQWCLYYPGVLDPGELDLSADERQALASSLRAYENGDLLQAVAQYPAERRGGSEAEQVYRAATLLAAGQAEQAQQVMSNLKGGGGSDRPVRLASALRSMVAAIKNQRPSPMEHPTLATEWMVESYRLQAEGKLAEALRAAENAVAKSPGFGFGWARVAELELSFGRMGRASEALDRSLAIAPRNVQSLAVRGFILLAQNRVSAAEEAFNQAIAIDGALGNAWLGRGLCKIRRGISIPPFSSSLAEAGRQDIQVATVLEPQRGTLRSYLGKAFSNSGDNQRALKELALAARLDPNDPTAWLYLALVEQQQNAINDSVRDLEKSKELNDNRQLFRSRLLLDEDQAIRGANLARIYQDTGPYNWNTDLPVSDWSTIEASRAVNYDYGNFAAHQFLANSYDALRDPNQVNLRYETPWFSELLLAQLLSPVGAGNLSDFTALVPTTQLFDKNHFGLISDTEYFSHGDWFERGSQYGTVDSVSYAIDGEYRSERGWRYNNDLEQVNVGAKVKYQVTPQDSILISGNYYDSSFGDNAQYYNEYGTIPGLPAPSATFRGIERQSPNLFLGYHHEWSPGMHTLFLGGRLDDTLKYTDPYTQIPFTYYRGGEVIYVRSQPFAVDYNRQLDGYTAELQQIFQNEWQTLVAGGRYQIGWNTTSSQVYNSNNVPPTISIQNLDTTLERYNVYAYETVKPWEPLLLTGGVAYDHLRYPENIDTSPMSATETETDQISPKAGFIWSITPDTHFRFAYTRSLGGVFYDSSVRLEPTQVAGFNQAFRSLIPESVVGLVPGTRFTTYAAGLEQSFKSNTYISLDGQILDSSAERTLGVVQNSGFFPVANAPGSTSQDLNYSEKSLVVTLNQLLAREWSAGVRYQLSQADLTTQFTDMSTAAAANFNQDVSAVFQQLVLYLNYYHPCGFFAQLQGRWTAQCNSDYNPPLDDSSFWQMDIYAGYRFLHRAAEVKLGILNVTDQNYLLNPLNLHYELPRERTLAVSLKLSF